MELLRRAVRSVVPYNSPIYRAASKAYNTAWVAYRQGPQLAMALNRLEGAKRGGEPEWLRFKGIVHPLLARPGTPDSMALVTTLVREDHGYFRPPADPLWIIDAGAYIGDSAAYFASKYPAASVVALEPDEGNFKIAGQNLAPYGERVRLLRKALSDRSGIVKFGGDYDGAAISNSGVEVEATTVPELMASAGWDRVSILKIDIEGAEEFVLNESADEWLPKVDFLILEIHGKSIEEKVRPTLVRNGFDMTLFRTSW